MIYMLCFLIYLQCSYLLFSDIKKLIIVTSSLLRPHSWCWSTHYISLHNTCNLSRLSTTFIFIHHTTNIASCQGPHTYYMQSFRNERLPLKSYNYSSELHTESLRIFSLPKTLLNIYRLLPVETSFASFPLNTTRFPLL